MVMGQKMQMENRVFTATGLRPAFAETMDVTFSQTRHSMTLFGRLKELAYSAPWLI